MHITPSLMDVALSIATPIGASYDANIAYRDSPIELGERVLPAGLILLDMTDFDVILGMDWLLAYHAIVDCFY